MREHCSEIYRFIVIALRGLENLFVIGPANFFYGFIVIGPLENLLMPTNDQL